MGAPFSGLAAVFGSALAPLAQDGIWHATTLSDTGAGSVTAATSDMPVKLIVESLSAAARIGLPRSAVRLVVLRSGLPGPIRLDDGITAGDMTYRVVEVASDPAGASFTLVGVPA